MWKKLSVFLLSIGLLGGAAYAGNLLSAAEESTLHFHQQDEQTHYVGNAFSYTLSGSREESVINITGGELFGNATSYEIPLQEGNVLRFADIEKPGFYQGDIRAEVQKEAGTSLYEIKGMISFTVYGIVYRLDHYEATVGETILPETSGALPDTLQNPIYQYYNDNPGVAQVDEQGYVQAIQEGECRIHMQVYDTQIDEDHLLYETDTLIRVNAAKEATWEEYEILDGEANGYRFVQSQVIYADREEQRIGHVALAQSGEYRYEIAEDLRDQYEMRNHELYEIAPQGEGIHQVTLYILAKDRNQKYELPISYTSVKAPEQADDPEFVFRYEGNDVGSIVRPFQTGNNAFQITSNQNLDEVRFSLKNEADAAYLSISEMGNVQVKEVTEHPVTIVARWKQRAYELNIIIEKADRNISCVNEDITVVMGDGAFAPLMEGISGSGHMVASIAEGSDIVELRYHEQGDLSIVPIKAGDAIVSIYQEGDSHYRKSNEVTLRIHVLARQVINDDWIGDDSWMDVLGEEGENGWYISPVQLSLSHDTHAQYFQYQDETYETMTLSENGQNQMPIKFINENGMSSTPARISVNIDTHAPMITSIQERKAADHPWKQMLDRLTFHQIYGTGMVVSIEASDLLMNGDVATSGVAQIQYQIYRLDGETETLLEEGVKNKENSIRIPIDDNGLHKICAKAVDNAGLQGENVCQIMDPTDSAVSIRGENTGMMITANHLQTSDHFTLQHVSSQERRMVAEQLGILDEEEALVGYHMEWNEVEPIDGDIQAIVPITSGMTQPILWYQKGDNGTLVQVTAQKENDAYVLELSSLQDIYYVKKGVTAQGDGDLRLANDNVQYSHVAQTNNASTRVALRPLSLMYENVPIVLIFSGGVLAVCVLILLIQIGKDHEEEW